MKGKLKRIDELRSGPSISEKLIKKYQLKDEEAQAIEDFLLPMLRFDITKRASAAEMLEHPWLSMKADFDYKLSEKELEKKLISKDVKEKKKEAIKLVFTEGEDEKNMADNEDNSDLDEEDSEETGFFEEPDIIRIKNFNNSFTAYGQYVNMSSLDRKNPQFEQN